MIFGSTCSARLPLYSTHPTMFYSSASVFRLSLVCDGSFLLPGAWSQHNTRFVGSATNSHRVRTFSCLAGPSTGPQLCRRPRCVHQHSLFDSFSFSFFFYSMVLLCSLCFALFFFDSLCSTTVTVYSSLCRVHTTRIHHYRAHGDEGVSKRGHILSQVFLFTTSA